MWFFQNTAGRGWRAVIEAPFFAGRQSVILFFVLSGFVLSVPYLRGTGQSYPMFLVRRILRIYCPYLFAVGLAVLGNSIWHGDLGRGVWAAGTWHDPVSWTAVWQHVLMIGAYPYGQFNTAFWSLIHEMRISIIFPFLFLAVRKIPLWAALILAATCSLAVHFTDILGGDTALILQTLEFVTTFICGILMAIHLTGLQRWYKRQPLWQRIALASSCLLFYDFSGHLPGLWKLAAWHISEWPVTIGACGLILIGLSSGTARALLGSVVPRFLGRISYSLYLVHGTVLYALTFLMSGKTSALVAFVIYLPTALLLSTVFCFWIEEPFLRLGRRVSRVSYGASGTEKILAQGNARGKRLR
jgi:peptidoglycan/LPS O-acetylase OafA/YrhL